ncbi:MAG TPA: hypothetical protein VM432_05460 [Bdellovibrionales bacterium]|nr:hypothetical protein [Bdellovibrionales bacterium]
MVRGRLLIIVMVFIFGCIHVHAGEPAPQIASKLTLDSLKDANDWNITHPSEDRLLLVHKKSKQAILIVEYPSRLSIDDAEVYFRTKFVREVQFERSLSLGLEDGLLKNSAAQTDVYDGVRYGEYSFEVDVPNGIAAFNERLWAARGRVWQVAMANYGAYTTSPESQKLQIDAVMNSIMAATAEKPSAGWLGFVLPKAFAAETAGGRSARPAPRSAPAPAAKPARLSCESPRLKFSKETLSACAKGAGGAFPKMMDATKLAFVNGLKDLERRAGKYQKYCLDPSRVPKGAKPQTSFAQFLTRLGEGAAQSQYADCMTSAGNSAMIEAGADMVKKTAMSIGGLIQWVSTTKDPFDVIGVILANKIDGFLCKSSVEQSHIACQFITQAAIAYAATVATAGVGGAAAGAVTAAKGISMAERGLVALNAGLKAAKAAAVSPRHLVTAPVTTTRKIATRVVMAGMGEGAGYAKWFKKFGFNPGMAKKMLKDDNARLEAAAHLVNGGRALTDAQKKAILKAHSLCPEQGYGTYSKSCITAKYRACLEQFQGGSCQRLMDAGITGQQVDSSQLVVDAAAAVQPLQPTAQSAQAAQAAHTAKRMPIPYFVEERRPVLVLRSDGKYREVLVDEYARSADGNVALTFTENGQRASKVVPVLDLKKAYEYGDRVDVANAEGIVREARIVARDGRNVTVQWPDGKTLTTDIEHIQPAVMRPFTTELAPVSAVPRKPVSGVSSTTETAPAANASLPRELRNVSSSNVRSLDEGIETVRARMRAKPRNFEQEAESFQRFNQSLMRIPSSQQRMTLRMVRSDLLDTEKWTDYSAKLMREAADQMRASGNPNLIKAANEGKLTRNAVLQVLVRRAKDRGDSQFSTLTNLESPESFAAAVRRGPFFDKGGEHLTTATARDVQHGMDSHLIQRDFVSGTVAKEWPGGEKSFYEFLGSDGNNQYWSQLFDQGGEVKNATSPGFFKDFFGPEVPIR